MMEEVFESCAKVVQTRIAVRCGDKAILGTFAVTGEAHIAIQAVLRQRIQLVLAKFDLLWRSHQLDHVLVLDIAQKIVGFDKMVARVEIAIVFDGQARAAGLVKDTHAGGSHAQPIAQRCLEGLHVRPCRHRCAPTRRR